MTERLQKIISARGICSRRKAEEMIQEGRVTCNGIVVKLGDAADPQTDEIRVDGELLPAVSSYVYIMLNKPRGYVTTLSDEKGRPNAAQLIDCGVRVYPVGRLDMDSEGLLLFTNDGDFANHLMHPKHEVEKTYDTWVTGYTPEGEEALRKPIELDGYRIRPPRIVVLQHEGDRAKIRITIHEGRNRQVRKMFEAVGHTVKALKRESIGIVELGNLPEGRWRYLTSSEIEYFRRK